MYELKRWDVALGNCKPLVPSCLYTHIWPTIVLFANPPGHSRSCLTPPWQTLKTVKWRETLPFKYPEVLTRYGSGNRRVIGQKPRRWQVFGSALSPDLIQDLGGIEKVLVLEHTTSPPSLSWHVLCTLLFVEVFSSITLHSIF